MLYWYIVELLNAFKNEWLNYVIKIMFIVELLLSNYLGEDRKRLYRERQSSFI
jgi:hypothetical protein